MIFDNGRERRNTIRRKNAMLIKERHLSSNHRGHTAVYNVLGNDYYWPDIKDHIKRRLEILRLAKNTIRKLEGG